MADILIKNGTVITMDPQRRVIEDGGIVIAEDRIIDVGASDELAARHSAPRIIDARRKAIMPGFIDGHTHAGHALLKSVGADNGELFYRACDTIYPEGSTEEFWYAESLLSSLEKLKCGTTCSVTFLGGSARMIMRTDDPSFGDRHCEAVNQVGLREFLAVGPTKGPYPTKFSRWNGAEQSNSFVSFEDQVATCETLIQHWHNKGDQKLRLCLTIPITSPDEITTDREVEVARAHARTIRDLALQNGLLFTQDGHTRGTIKFAHEQLNLLGDYALLSHSTGLTEEEIEICKQTNSKIVHNPSAIFSIRGRCPVPELLDAGVTVLLGSDGCAPDRSFDMFRHMAQCMRYHRTYFHDPSYLPPGKILEMVTIDAARALGVDNELGSLEIGKKADLILLDMFKPHLYPLYMPLYRIPYFADGADVDTVIVNGKVLMEQRVVKSVDEGEVLELAQKVMDEALDRTGLWHLLDTPEKFWGHSKY